MKIFLDTAHVESIKKWLGIIDGVTTNPSLLAQEGDSPSTVLATICELGLSEVSVEVTEEKPEAVYKQAQKIAAYAPNIIVKIPCKSEYISVIKQLVSEGIKLNITLIFSLSQAVYMSKLGVKYISPFVGRLDDINEDGMALVRDIRAMLDHYSFSTLLLAASIRHTAHVQAAVRAGADVITMPEKVLNESFEHSLTEKGIKKFLDDWKKCGVRQFP